MLTNLQQNEEEQARQLASSLVSSNSKDSKCSLLAGTLAETLAATSRWGNVPSSEDVEQRMRESSLNKHESFVRSLQKKLAVVMCYPVLPNMLNYEYFSIFGSSLMLSSFYEHFFVSRQRKRPRKLSTI